jgi:phosphoglycerate kinase
VAEALQANVATRTVTLKEIGVKDMILDIGPKTVQLINDTVKNSKSVVWNGPLGAFETPPFDQGTKKVAAMIASATQQKNLVSVAGGGDTVSALIQAGVEEELSYVSSAGGAFLEWLEGKTLPGIQALLNPQHL